MFRVSGLIASKRFTCPWAQPLCVAGLPMTDSSDDDLPPGLSACRKQRGCEVQISFTPSFGYPLQCYPFDVYGKPDGKPLYPGGGL